MIKLPNKHFYDAVVIIWLTLSLGSVVLAGITWSQLGRLASTGRQVIGIGEDLDRILQLLLDAEAGARGYVITGDKKFLEPLNQCVTNLPVCFDTLAQAAPDAAGFLDQAAAMHAQAEVCLAGRLI